jgi:hypothetical protein
MNSSYAHTGSAGNTVRLHWRRVLVCQSGGQPLAARLSGRSVAVLPCRPRVLGEPVGRGTRRALELIGVSGKVTPCIKLEPPTDDTIAAPAIASRPGPVDTMFPLRSTLNAELPVPTATGHSPLRGSEPTTSTEHST